VAIRLAIVNDYEVVVRGLASMLRSYSDRIEVVEVDVNAHPASSVDIALFDTFAQSFRDRARIARLVSDPMEDSRARRLLATKYQGWREGAPLSEWARTSLVLAVERTNA